MLEKIRRSAVLRNPWLAAILCVVLVGLWFTRWQFQASKTFDEGAVKWYTDRWTGKTWMRLSSLKGAGALPVTSLEGDAAQEYRGREESRVKSLTQLWGCAFVLSLAWLGIALSKTYRPPLRL